MQDNQQKTVSSKTDKSYEQRFVDAIFNLCQKNKGTAARLCRADNPATEYQCWEVLGQFGVDLEKDYKRLPFATIASAIAKSKAEYNGSLALGKALLACYDNDRESDPAKMRLRRLLACDEVTEVCRILRPILSLINGKVSQPLDYARLLRQLQFFGHWTKTQWAQEFYSHSSGTTSAENVA